MALRSIKPTPARDHARSVLPWFRRAEKWMDVIERAGPRDNPGGLGHQQLKAALLLIDDIRPRIEALLPQPEGKLE